MSRTERSDGGRFQPGRSGNPAGRPPGSRNKTTLAVEALIEGGAEKMTRQLVELAGYGNLAAVRICLDRLAPRRKGRPIAFPLPKLEQAGDAVAAASAVAEGVASAELTPGEAAELFRVIEAFERVRQRSDLERRVASLEMALAAPVPAGRDAGAVAPETPPARAETPPDSARSAAQPADENAAAERTDPPAAAETPAPDNTGESTGRAAAPDPVPTPGSPETTGESTGGPPVIGATAAAPPPPRRPEPPEWPEWPEYPQYLALQEKRRQAELAAQSPTGGT